MMPNPLELPNQTAEDNSIIFYGTANSLSFLHMVKGEWA